MLTAAPEYFLQISKATVDAKGSCREYQFRRYAEACRLERDDKPREFAEEMVAREMDCRKHKTFQPRQFQFVQQQELARLELADIDSGEPAL
jgi:hypothetical protein